MFELMRQHGAGYHPARAPVHANTCMHAGPQKDSWWQADGAMVADVRGVDILVWATGTSGNCLSIFKPVFPCMDLPEIGPVPTEHFDPRSLWWKHELLHRRAMADFEGIVPEIRSDFDLVEAAFLAESESVRRGSDREKRDFMEHCFERAMEKTDAWIARLRSRTDLAFQEPAYRRMWAALNSAAGLTGHACVEQAESAEYGGAEEEFHGHPNIAGECLFRLQSGRAAGCAREAGRGSSPGDT